VVCFLLCLENGFDENDSRLPKAFRRDELRKCTVFVDSIPGRDAALRKKWMRWCGTVLFVGSLSLLVVYRYTVNFARSSPECCNGK
jgi:hypothetical protein